jgi:hypothetical protein
LVVAADCDELGFKDDDDDIVVASNMDGVRRPPKSCSFEILKYFGVEMLEAFNSLEMGFSLLFWAAVTVAAVAAAAVVSV